MANAEKPRCSSVSTELSSPAAEGRSPAVHGEHLAHVIELWTKIPASKIREEEFQRLSQLEDRLKEHIVGQDEAIAAVSAAVRRNRVGICPQAQAASALFSSAPPAWARRSW